ncbi:MerR family transcriptional regulator [Streptomyces albipurpureus]|uniref:MerR family transcriptional regulator n=1 Tax=Streptomyces albipurpureus TaxID=2897419 RepID=A0ABT0UHU2_9ACTN|nr:MerR family transcriptional regulator [Streptomyces sp. CWNU-1]MCM2388213.1 MerR family transcriptional regulator [Streptomyces sp. CWNU-1]
MSAVVLTFPFLLGTDIAVAGLSASHRVVDAAPTVMTGLGKACHLTSILRLQGDLISNRPMDDPLGVSIGQAAALYGLAPSTLRWWESQRGLPEPPRVNGRRVYTETELRRIGLAYLCCVVAAMPLEQSSVVTSGSRNRRWQSTVRHHAELIEEKIKQLQSAHAYLLHLLQCPDDDIVSQCPDLDDELMSHTPRRRIATQGLVAAARSISHSEPAQRQRDENGSARDENAAPSGRCAICAGPLNQPARGRRRTYCSRACQQRQYRRNADRPSV